MASRYLWYVVSLCDSSLQLPDPKFRLPREKPAPRPRELTRWDRFAQMKGITKRKKSRKVWDEASQTWKPRWGKDRIDSVKDKWVLEVPGNAGMYRFRCFFTHTFRSI